MFSLNFNGTGCGVRLRRLQVKTQGEKEQRFAAEDSAASQLYTVREDVAKLYCGHCSWAQLCEKQLSRPVVIW